MVAIATFANTPLYGNTVFLRIYMSANQMTISQETPDSRLPGGRWIACREYKGYIINQWAG